MLFMVKWKRLPSCSPAPDCVVGAWPCKAGSPLLAVEPPELNPPLDPQKGRCRVADADHRLDRFPILEVIRFLQQELVAVRAFPLDLHRAMNAAHLADRLPAATTADVDRVALGFLLVEPGGQPQVDFVLVLPVENFLEPLNSLKFPKGNP